MIATDGCRVVKTLFLTLVFVLLAPSWGICAEKETGFDLPPSGATVWEAELAKSPVPWQLIRDLRASGGAYVEPPTQAKTPVLEFAFQVDRDTILQVYPRWWIHGERKAAQRYPAPLPSLHGPDVLVACGRYIYFTAPACGRVCVFDPVGEKVIKTVSIGGYLTDMVADPSANLVYVADSLGDRVVVLDTKTNDVAHEIIVPAGPCSLALYGGNLYVACRETKMVAVIDTHYGWITQKITLPIAPATVEVIQPDAKKTGDKAKLIVRPMPRLFDPSTLEEKTPDDTRYVARSTGVVKLSVKVADTVANKYFEAAPPHKLRVRFKGTPDKYIDLSSVTGASPILDKFPLPFRPQPGPGVLDNYRNLLYFTSPSTGQVGVVDMSTEKLIKNIKVGGYLVDLIVGLSIGKVYVADALGHRIVVIDAKKQEILTQISVPEMPYSLAIEQGGTLFVACRKAKTITVVDGKRNAIVRQMPMLLEPLSITMLNPLSPEWWPLLPSERIPAMLSPRLCINSAPLVFEADTLNPIILQEYPSESPRRQKLDYPPAPAQTLKSFFAENKLVLGIAPKRWIDVSLFCDPQLLPAAPLSPKDLRGTITFSMDSGPEYDWTRNIWMTPDQELLLVNDTEEFWRWNAPRFTLRPGAHVLRVHAYSPFAALDALSVSRTLQDRVGINITPTHSEDVEKSFTQPPAQPLASFQQAVSTTSVPTFPLPKDEINIPPSQGWRSVFYDNENISFNVQVTGVSPGSSLIYNLRNYMGEVVEKNQVRLAPDAQGNASATIILQPKDWGRFTLTVIVESPDGQAVQDHRFLRLPKLDHPRLLFRKEDIPAIKARIAQHPLFYKRFAEWLRRECQEGRFLPKGLSAKTLGDLREYRLEHRVSNRATPWREYELAWRALACQFADMFLVEPGDDFFKNQIAPLLAEPKTDTYCMYHHHGPFFPGAVASFFDIAAMDSPEGRQSLQAMFASKIGDMNVFPWFIVAMEEPLTPLRRALFFKIAMWTTNWERYFQAHCGIRGGLWWLNPRTDCHCPTAGYILSSLYIRHLFKEERFFEKDFHRGLFTFHNYWHPQYDNQGLLCSVEQLKPRVGGEGPPPNMRPLGEPARWIGTALCGHPLEKFLYGWDRWVARLETRFFGPTESEVEQLFRRQGAPCVPLALAFGWYTPGAPQVRWEELPPTALFDVEGMVAMRSNWSRDMTEIIFTCGARDHTTRWQPTDFRLLKAGEVLIGTLALQSDHGNPIPSWGNVVVAGNDWPGRWKANLWHCRAEEFPIINRFSLSTWNYLARASSTTGFIPAERGYGGGLDLHGHTQSAFVREGHIVAFETWLTFDYVAGDATNAWPVEQVTERYRQVLFLKPDVLVIYDRIGLRSDTEETAWVAATAPDLTAGPTGFTVKSGASALEATVLLPTNPIITMQAAATYKGLAVGKQAAWHRVIEIRPPAPSRQVDYLVLLKTGQGQVMPIQATPVISNDYAGVQFLLNGRKIEVAFARRGVPGGRLSINQFRHDFPLRVDDSYRHWSSDPRYAKWVAEERFRFVVRDSLQPQVR